MKACHTGNRDSLRNLRNSAEQETTTVSHLSGQIITWKKKYKFYWKGSVREDKSRQNWHWGTTKIEACAERRQLEDAQHEIGHMLKAA